MKILTNTTLFEKKEGVFISPIALNTFKAFESSYVSTRFKEKRILSIEEIRKLPNVAANSMHIKEWGIRKKNIRRFLKYLNQKKSKLRILDIGCGNGFFTHMMSNGNELVGVDVNLTELKQAAQAFPIETIHWYYLDIMKEDFPEKKFDLITFCASFQYFDNPKELLIRCMDLLNKNGEIHIIDSPFYSPKTLSKAKENSSLYYKKIGNEGMINYYKHNTYEVLQDYSFIFKYKPNSFFTKLLRIQDSPFPWLMIKK